MIQDRTSLIDKQTVYGLLYTMMNEKI